MFSFSIGSDFHFSTNVARPSLSQYIRPFRLRLRHPHPFDLVFSVRFSFISQPVAASWSATCADRVVNMLCAVLCIHIIIIIIIVRRLVCANISISNGIASFIQIRTFSPLMCTDG